MVTHSTRWQRLDWQLRARQTRSYRVARRIYEELYRQARRLGQLPSRDPLEGLEADVRLARALQQLGQR